MEGDGGGGGSVGGSGNVGKGIEVVCMWRGVGTVVCRG